jgi:hypothetical protein
MALVTETPVALVSADNWTIANVQIDPAIPAVVYQVVAKLGGDEVRRTTVSVVGAELIDSEEMAQLYGTVKALLYGDAMARGHIPPDAQEIE